MAVARAGITIDDRGPVRQYPCEKERARARDGDGMPHFDLWYYLLTLAIVMLNNIVLTEGKNRPTAIHHLCLPLCPADGK